jgi:membrane protein required for colicin V production
MTWVDYSIVAALVVSVLMGLWRGFIAEVLAIVCWVLAFWVAYAFGGALAEKFAASISVPSARLLLGYAICFIAVILAGAIVGFVLRKLVQSSGLTGSDRMLGMVFGLARGLVLVTLSVLLLGFTPFPRDSWWHESRLLPSFQISAEWLSARLPSEVAKYLDLRGVLPIELPKPGSPKNDPVASEAKKSTK